MKNTNIERQEITKEQLAEATTDNAYVSMKTHISELDEKQKEINNIQNTAGQATATASQILKNYTAYKDGKLITGTMVNYTAITQDATTTSDDNYTYVSIPKAGYYSTNSKLRIPNNAISNNEMFWECVYTHSMGAGDASITVSSSTDGIIDTYSYTTLINSKASFSLFEIVYDKTILNWRLTAIKDIETLEGHVKLKAGESINWRYSTNVTYIFVKS